MANALIFLGVFTLVLFIVVLGVFLFPDKCVRNAEKGDGYFGQLKIILAFVQILSSMPGVFDTVPWPIGFIEFTFPLNFVNLDFLSVFMAESCSLSIPIFGSICIAHDFAGGLHDGRSGGVPKFALLSEIQQSEIETWRRIEVSDTVYVWYFFLFLFPLVFFFLSHFFPQNLYSTSHLVFVPGLGHKNIFRLSLQKHCGR